MNTAKTTGSQRSITSPAVMPNMICFMSLSFGKSSLARRKPEAANASM